MAMRHAFALLALLIAAPAGAQSSILTLRDALATARVHSPLLPAASGRVATATGSARQMSALPNPVVELRREHFSSPLAKDDYATVTIPVDLTMRRSALRTAGRNEVAATLADSAVTARELDAAVTSTYLQSALANELASIAADRARALKGMAEFETTRFGEGAVAEGVALRTRLESDRAQLELAAARADAERARAALARAMGVAPSDSTALAALPAEPTPGDPLAMPDAAVTVAMERRPEVTAAERRVAAARSMVSAEWRATLPDVGVQLGAKRTGGYDTGVAAISIGLPIFDRGSGARQRARGEQQTAEAELRYVRDRIRAEAAGSLRAYREILAARPAGTAALVRGGAEVARIAEASYREGAITLMELLDAERAHADFRSALARWSAEVALVRMEVNRALGAPIEEGL
jgi:cobalt-zinc-cadmium efflux system outer membrane protein